MSAGRLAKELKQKFMPLDGEDTREMMYRTKGLSSENSAVHYNISPYAYVLSNPISFIDPYGLDTAKPRGEMLPPVIVSGLNKSFNNPFDSWWIRCPIWAGGLASAPLPKKWLGVFIAPNSWKATSFLSATLGEWKKPINFMGKRRLYTNTLMVQNDMLAHGENI